MTNFLGSINKNLKTYFYYRLSNEKKWARSSCKQTIAIHILPTYYLKKQRKLDNEIFLEISYAQCGGETIPRILFLKINIEHISGRKVSSFIQFVFIVFQVQKRNLLKVTCRPLAFTLLKFFLKKIKIGLGLASLPYFLHYLWRKIFIFIQQYLSIYLLLTDQISLSGCLSFVRYWAIHLL